MYIGKWFVYKVSNEGEIEMNKIKDIKAQIEYHKADTDILKKWCSTCKNGWVGRAQCKCAKHGIVVSYFGTCKDWSR